MFVQPNALVLAQLAHLVEQGQLRPVIGEEYALHDIQLAHALSEKAHVTGKIALWIGQP